MSSDPDDTKLEQDPAGQDELPAKPLRGQLATWGPRVVTLGYLGLNLWQAQQIPGLHGVVGNIFPFLGTNLPDRFTAKRMTLTLSSPLLIWTVEGYRKANSMTPLAFLFSRDATGAGRKVDPLAAMAVFPATIVGHVLPSILMDTLPLTATEFSRSYFTLQSIVCYAFYLSPITVSVLTKGFSAVVKWLRRKRNSRSTPVTCKEATNVKASRTGFDLPILQTAYSMMLAFQIFQNLSGVLEALRMMYEVLQPFSWADRLTLLMNMRPGSVSYIFGTEQGPSFSISSSLMLFTSSTIAFILYSVWDLRRRGYITNREAVKAVLGVSAAPIAPGAAYAGLWLWREKILYRVTHHARPKSHIQE
ncbi:hypothetical protein N0V82_001184 [Gnomoniopsis sp. IMI 355080]|nr:hypothetical protein N0V82_001184 [Gnomoniopsis sp. IMI 355080]